MKKTIATGFMILMLFGVGLFSGCTEFEAVDNKQDITPPPTCPEGLTKCIGTDKYTCINDAWVLTAPNCMDCGYVPPTQPTPADQFDNIEFLGWMGGVNEVIMEKITLRRNALENELWYSLEIYAQEFEELITNTYLPECQDFTLSYTYDKLRDEFYECLYDLSFSEFHYKLYAQNMQDGSYSLAISNLENAIAYGSTSSSHLRICMSMLDDL